MLLNAEFLFAVQIIVYAGAILVLYLFVLMLLNLKTEEQYLHRKYAFLLFVGVGILGELLLLMLQSPYGGVKGKASPQVVLGDRSEPCGGHYDVQRLSVVVRNRGGVPPGRDHRRHRPGQNPNDGW